MTGAGRTETIPGAARAPRRSAIDGSFDIDATGLVGRLAELETLDRVLERLARAPAALLLEGSPGIGKTTVWRQARGRALARGMLVLSCRPVEAEVKQAFASLTDLLEPVADAALPHLPHPQRVALEVALLRASPAGAPPSERAVAAAVLSCLKHLAATAPVVLAIDDLQWLDRATAHALAFALRRVGEHRVGVVAALRIGADAPPAQLALDGAFAEQLTRVRLGPMSLSALHHVLRAQLEHVFPRPTLRRIADASGGNPLFALELGRALLDAGASPAPGEPLPVPDGVTTLVLRRLARLPAGVRRSLLVVAAMSSPTVELLRTAVGERDAEAAIAFATQARLVEVAGDGLRYAHPLIASALYASAAPHERRMAHRRLATHVAAPEERARHLALACTQPDEDAARALDEAASIARRRGATDAAGDLQEQAASLTPRHDAAQGRRRRALAAEHFFHAGDRVRARALLADVLAGEPGGAARARALHLLGRIRGQEDSFLDAIPHLEEALRHAEEPDVRVAIQLDLAFAVFSAGDLPRAASLAREARAEAERLGDPGLVADALAVSVIGDFAIGRGPDWPAIERALALEDRTRAVQPMLRPTALAGQLAAAEGRFALAYARLRELCDWATERGEESELPFLLLGLSRSASWLGDFATAARHADEAMLLAVQTGNESMRAVAYAHRAAARGARGDVAGARADLAVAKPLCEATGYAQAIVWTLATEGELELSLGAPAAAARALAPLVAVVEATGVVEPFVVYFVPDAVEALAGAGEVERAAALLERSPSAHASSSGAGRSPGRCAARRSWRPHGAISTLRSRVRSRPSPPGRGSRCRSI